MLLARGFVLFQVPQPAAERQLPSLFSLSMSDLAAVTPRHGDVCVFLPARLLPWPYPIAWLQLLSVTEQATCVLFPTPSKWKCCSKSLLYSFFTFSPPMCPNYLVQCAQAGFLRMLWQGEGLDKTIFFSLSLFPLFCSFQCGIGLVACSRTVLRSW